MSNENTIPSIIKETREAASYTPAETKEPRQVTTTDDMHPDPSKSIPLPPNRQKLIDDVIALYSCEPTIERVSRYAPNCVCVPYLVLWADCRMRGLVEMDRADRCSPSSCQVYDDQ